MESIELTKEQKSKLEEMTKVLFPNEGFNYFYSGHDIMSFGLEEISWFEFCMTHLKNKILGVLDYKKTEEFLMRILFQCEAPHPVDYLYEEFKKLK